jgi:hypothetical protein
MEDIFGNTSNAQGFFSKPGGNNFFGKNTGTATSNNPVTKNPANISFSQSQANKPVMSFPSSNPSSENKNTFLTNPQKNDTGVPGQQSNC